MIKKNTCHCCLGKNNKKLLIIKNFPTQTVNNSPQRYLIGLKKKINLVLYLCLNCKNIFYSHKFTYSNLYNNFNSRPFNYKNIEQYKFYFNKLKKLANLSSKDLIYDIGKNNYNLKKILLVGNKIAYFDPRKKNFNSNLSFASTKKKNNKTVIKPKIINSYNFIGNILNIDNFFFNIKKILHQKGVIGLYFHYGPSIIKKFSLDKIYLEHVNYLSITGLNILLERYNFKIIDLAFYEDDNYCHVLIKHSNEKILKNKQNIKKIIKVEKNITINVVKKFKKKLFFHKKKVNHFLKKIHRSKQEIIGYGASISSFPIILIFNLTRYLNYIYDDFPLSKFIYLNNKFIKINKFKKKFYKNKINFIILAPRYLEVIKYKILNNLKNDRIVSILPTLKIYSKT